MRALVLNFIVALAPTLSFFALQLYYDWPNRSRDYWQSIEGSGMEMALTMLGGSFGSLLGTLLWPGLVLVIICPKAFIVSKSCRSQIQALLLTFLFFGIPVAIYFMRSCMSKWNWHTGF
jgi:hypothetical protein